MTSAQLVAYLDAAQDRLAVDADARFTEAVEAVRIGTIIAQDRKAYGRWRTRRRHPAAIAASDGGGLSGKALESAVMGLARQHPEYVVMGA